jgi:poly(A) polymerase
MEEFSAAPLVPPRLVDGRDIMALGIPSGPEVGRWLGEIQTLQLEGKLADREAALEWLRENAPPPRRSP